MIIVVYINQNDKSVCIKSTFAHLMSIFSPVNVHQSQAPQSCGYNRYRNDSPLTERIVGGNNSIIGEWPWQVSKLWLI